MRTALEERFSTLETSSLVASFHRTRRGRAEALSRDDDDDDEPCARLTLDRALAELQRDDSSLLLLSSFALSCAPVPLPTFHQRAAHDQAPLAVASVGGLDDPAALVSPEMK
jgi:hypothetical protein